MDSEIKSKGFVNYIIKNKNGTVIESNFTNTVLKRGREALAASIANEYGNEYNFYISRMIFGDNGSVSGVPKTVDSSRNGLFGPSVLSKSVISIIDPQARYQTIFTSVLDYDEGNGFTLNEMALQMNTGNLYSMATFPDLNKTSDMSITWSWRIVFI